jgi:hypothetical protein
MHTGIVMLAVAFLLIWVGRPSKSGIHRKILEGLVTKAGGIQLSARRLTVVRLRLVRVIS